MPLRDHFRPPVSSRSSWEGFHGGWPMAMVQKLSPLLPENFTAEPRVHLGSYFEIDVCAYEANGAKVSAAEESGGVATATKIAPEPTLAVNVDLAEQYEYEVLVFDESRNRRLVAAVEIVSPANKDRPENRRAFVIKCASLLQQGVCVSMVDLVTIRDFNLYTDLLELLNQSDRHFMPSPPPVYAVTCRYRKIGGRTRLETWAHPLMIGEALPSLPIWLSNEVNISLDLEASYEETCRVLRIP
jgi:Protein of unknown function (DUF4058)